MVNKYDITVNSLREDHDELERQALLLFANIDAFLNNGLAKYLFCGLVLNSSVVFCVWPLSALLFSDDLVLLIGSKTLLTVTLGFTAQGLFILALYYGCVSAVVCLGLGALFIELFIRMAELFLSISYFAAKVLIKCYLASHYYFDLFRVYKFNSHPASRYNR